MRISDKRSGIAQRVGDVGLQAGCNEGAEVGERLWNGQIFPCRKRSVAHSLFQFFRGIDICIHSAVNGTYDAGPGVAGKNPIVRRDRHGAGGAVHKALGQAR